MLGIEYLEFNVYNHMPIMNWLEWDAKEYIQRMTWNDQNV